MASPPMTVPTAYTKVCPFSPSTMRQVEDEVFDAPRAQVCCVGPACMMWMWDTLSTPPAPTDTGHCGLIVG